MVGNPAVSSFVQAADMLPCTLPLSGSLVQAARMRPCSRSHMQGLHQLPTHLHLCSSRHAGQWCHTRLPGQSPPSRECRCW